MDELRTLMMFERESGEKVRRMTRIGEDLWRIETKSDRVYQVRSYTGPLSED